MELLDKHKCAMAKTEEGVGNVGVSSLFGINPYYSKQPTDPSLDETVKLLQAFFGTKDALVKTTNDELEELGKVPQYAPIETFFGKKGAFINPTKDELAEFEKATQKEPIEVPKTVDPKEATKFDAGKTDWTLVPFDGLEDMVKVLEFGAKKYARNNWQSNGGFNHTRILNSLMRHLFAYSAGENLDTESGISHIGHAQCNLLFLAHYLKHPDKFTKDDRFKG